MGIQNIRPTRRGFLAGTGLVIGLTLVGRQARAGADPGRARRTPPVRMPI